MPAFTDLGLTPQRQAQLAARHITEPTPVQVESIPPLLEGRDALIQSQTGSGKTLAYLLPLLAKVEGTLPGERPTLKDGLQVAVPRGVILVPTQELGMQVKNVAQDLLNESGLKVLSLIGGANPVRQAEALKKGCDIIVGTPGRILQFMREGRLSGAFVKVVIGDEADQLFDQGNRADMEAILKATSPSRQTIFCSATIGMDVPTWGTRYLKDPAIISIQSELKLPPIIQHLAFIVEERDKLVMVRRLVRNYDPVGAIAFINKGELVDEWVAKLRFHHMKVDGLHSGSKKLARAGTMRDFKEGKLQLLLATELAARGLDLSAVSLVVNMELPTDPAHYVHRVGRTGRMGRPGTAITLVSSKEAFVLTKLEKALGIKFEYPVLAHGEVRERTEKDEVKEVKREQHEKKKEVAKVKAVEAGPLPKPKKPKKKGPTEKALAKGKAKKAKKRAHLALRTPKAKTDGAPASATPATPMPEN